MWDGEQLGAWLEALGLGDLAPSFLHHNVNGGTVFLLTEEHLRDLGFSVVGDRLYETDQGVGYDHCFCLRARTDADGLRAVCRVHDASSGRWMSVRSDQPGVQLYTGNYLDGVAGRGGVTYAKHHGFCLETQHFPDSANQPQFPSTL